MASLILTDLGGAHIHKNAVAKLPNRAVLTGHLIYVDLCPSGLNGLYPNKRKETNINARLSSRILLPPSGAAAGPVPLIMYENWAGVDIMYQSDGRWRRQSLVCFGNQ